MYALSSCLQWVPYALGMASTQANWAGNQRWVAAERAMPRSTDEVAAIVRRAAEAGTRVKAIGAGHSFTAAAETSGVQLSLDRMDRVLDVDPTTGPGPGAGGHPPPPAQRRPRRGRAGDAEPRRHRPPVDRRRHRHRHPRHRARARQPGDDGRRDGARHRHRRRRAASTPRRTPSCCAWPASASARSASSPRSRCSACRRSCCTPARPSSRSTTCSTGCSTRPPPSTTSSCTGCRAAASAAR